MSIAAVSSGLAHAVAQSAKPAHVHRVNRDAEQDKAVSNPEPQPAPKTAKGAALNLLV